MTLGKKRSIIIGVALCALIAGIYLILQPILLKKCQQLENEYVLRDVKHILAEVDSRIKDLDRITSDYASWCDAFQYFRDGDQGEINSNLVLNSAKNFKINYFLVFDRNGDKFYTKGWDYSTGKVTTVSDSFLNKIVPGSSIFSTVFHGSHVSGFIETTDGILMMSARPILASDSSGPARGMLVFAKKIDLHELLTLDSFDHTSITLISTKDSVFGPQFGDKHVQDTDNSIWVKVKNKDIVSGYFLLNDIYGKPYVCVQVDFPRDITRQGQNLLTASLIFLLVIGVFFGGIVLFWFDRITAKRILGLSEKIETIESKGDLSLRLSVSEYDEMGNFVNNINRMLAALERSNLSMVNREKYFRSLIENSSAIIFVLDNDGRVLSVNKSIQSILGYSVDSVLEEVPEFLQELFKKIIADPNDMIFEFRCKHLMGMWVNLECVTKNLLDEPGVEGIVVTLHDITDRKKSEATLRVDEQRLEVLLDLNQKSHASVEEVADFVLEHGARLTGSQLGYLALAQGDEDIFKVYRWVDSEQSDFKFDRKVSLHNVGDFELWTQLTHRGSRLIMNDCSDLCSIPHGLIVSQMVPERFMTIPIFDDTDKLAAIVGFANKGADYNEADVSQISLLMDGVIKFLRRQQKEKETSEAQLAISNLMGNLPGMVYKCSIDERWTMKFVSDGCFGLTGYSAQELVGPDALSYPDLIHYEDQLSVLEVVTDAIAKEEAYRVVYRLITATGELKWVCGRGKVVRDKKSGTKTLQGFIFDITESKIAGEEIEICKAELKGICNSISDAGLTIDAK